LIGRPGREYWDRHDEDDKRTETNVMYFLLLRNKNVCIEEWTWCLEEKVSNFVGPGETRIK
jgi:hypothetical protein